MSSKWHPDRFAKKNETQRNEAEKTFMDIQKACGMLNKIKQERERKSTWSESATEQTETVIPEQSSSDVGTHNDDADTKSDKQIDDEGNYESDFDGNGDDDEGGEFEDKTKQCDKDTC